MNLCLQTNTFMENWFIIYMKQINMEFSPTQQLAYDHYLNGDNVFITGPGGTGKSYFIKKVYEKRETT